MSPPSARSGSGSSSRLILASASPRRRAILERLGVDFEVVVPEVDELRQGQPEAVVLENARRKAHWGRRRAGERATYVLGVDTDVGIDGRVIGKPADELGARERLEALSGRTHEVLSGVVVIGTALGASDVPVERAAVARTQVTFVSLDEGSIDLYLASGEWRDRAGAYAIQGLGSILIERIEGDFSNVVGLPVPTLLELVPRLLS